MTAIDDSLSAVTTAGDSVTLAIPDRLRGTRIHRVVVEQTAGSASSFTVDVSTDATFADLTQRVAQFTGNATVADYDNGGVGYAWEREDAGGNVYVQVTPDAGSDNDYRIRLLFMEA